MLFQSIPSFMSNANTDAPLVINAPPLVANTCCTPEGRLSPSITLIENEGSIIFYTHNQHDRELIYNEYQEEPCVNLYFSLEGISAAYPKGNNANVVLTDNHHIIQYTPYFEGQYSISGPRLRNFGISLSESFFQRLLITDFECLKRFWDKIHNGQLAHISPYPMPVTARQKGVIMDIQHCSYTGQMRTLYFESKIIELFLLQAEQAENLKRRQPQPIKATDVDKLHAARQFVQQHMLEPLTLDQVARETGLNDFKLKKGFKELFGYTVFGYVNELKMEHARQLLLDTACTVFEVAYSLGYHEPYNFSKAFKKHFGYLPGQLKG
jgi:AraC-like DNA-binding protein